MTTIETRSGSNDWRYLFTGTLPRPRWRDGKIFGIGAATPRIAVGGPIKKDKLFFFQSVEYRFVRTNVPSLEALDESQRDIKRESFDSFSRVDYVVNNNNRLTAQLLDLSAEVRLLQPQYFQPVRHHRKLSPARLVSRVQRAGDVQVRRAAAIEFQREAV